MTETTLIGVALIGASLFAYFMVVVGAMFARVVDVKLDMLADSIDGSELPPLFIIDDLCGTARFARLFHLFEDRDDGSYANWVLTVLPGVLPSTVIAEYPGLVEREESIEFEEIATGGVLTTGIYDDDDSRAMFSRLELAFTAPSPSASFAINVDTIASFLADEYARMSRPQRQSPTMMDALTDRLRTVLDIDVVVTEAELVEQAS